jgi:acyl carrier protein
MIAERLNVDLAEVVPEASLVTDLKADSLDVVDLTMKLEERLDIEIEDSEAEKLKTVGIIHDFVIARLAETANAV